MLTLGCAKNTVDTEIILGDLSRRGYTFTPNPAEAEILIINTCGFIEAAKQESVDTILEMAEWKRKGKCRVLVVTGCLSQRYGEQLLADMPEVDGVFGTGSFNLLPEKLPALLQGERLLLVDSPSFDYDAAPTRLRVTPNHSAYVKIAEGCDNRCSYCAIPLVRGSYRSRRRESILQEIRGLVAEGVQEINLIAQDTTRYGLDIYGNYALVELLDEVLKQAGPSWLRLLYCYPTHFTDELIELIAKEDRILNYLDIPLQHASPRILKDMKRPSDLEACKKLLHKLRQAVPDLTLRTSFIVGFPGEQEEDVEILESFMREMKFDHVGIFTYSQEEDTEAGVRTDQISAKIKTARKERLLAVQREISAERNQRFLGKEIEVLIEKAWPEGKGVIGRSRKDAPEVDGVVYIPDCSIPVGRLTTVTVVEAHEYDLVGVC